MNSDQGSMRSSILNDAPTAVYAWKHAVSTRLKRSREIFWSTKACVKGAWPVFTSALPMPLKPGSGSSVNGSDQ